MYSVREKTVLVTGAARGIGAAVARELHARGARVSLVGLEPELLADLAAELGPRARFSIADVTDLAALETAAAATVAEFGSIDVVIANAGIAPPTTTVADISVADFERTVDVDLYGVWRTVKATLPHVIAARGHVVLISSIYSFMNGVLNASYAVSKAGVEQLGRAMRTELAPRGVTVGVAYFGFIETDMVGTAFARPAADRIRKALPAFITRPAQLDVATGALVTGIENRSARIIAPAWVRAALPLRGLLGLLDARLAADRRIREAIGVAEGAGKTVTAE